VRMTAPQILQLMLLFFVNVMVVLMIIIGILRNVKQVVAHLILLKMSMVHVNVILKLKFLSPGLIHAVMPVLLVLKKNLE